MLLDIATDPNAIGLMSSTEARETKILALSDDGTEALYPSVFTIKTEEYLFTRRLYLASFANNSNPYIRQFIDFCLADEHGQKIVAQTGFVNLNLHNTSTRTVSQNAPPQYLAATSGSKRSPTTLHFQSGSSTPDERATDDIKRIINVLAESENQQKKVIVIGFTDNTGSMSQNQGLSMSRAQHIQTEFQKYGIKSEVYGFGQALPIATNKSILGQNKNRRVEVWLK